ncbi:MgtC/SapB family protein [Patescibacteria group bacterium]|nr:MgtC/SapB family protein [Patescibacteria group bacterium]MBU0964369.1 MgtC/SapB family protein [Patescibacteria group bacterium]
MPNESTIILRIFLTIILCGLIGLERKHYHKPAGFRTNVMVGLGSAIIALTAISIYGTYNESSNVDIGRIVGQIVTGIGFLGAGAIIQARGSVHGLTTAASIWVVAAIGMSIGLGFYLIAVTGTLASLLVLVILGRIEHKFEFKITDESSDRDQSTE